MGTVPSSSRGAWLGAAALQPGSGAPADVASFPGTERGLPGVSEGQWPHAGPQARPGDPRGDAWLNPSMRVAHQRCWACVSGTPHGHVIGPFPRTSGPIS